MIEHLAAAIAISLLHGLIPSHWLPMLAIGRKYDWPLRKIMGFTLKTSAAHALSTAGIGLTVAFVGRMYGDYLEEAGHWIPAMLLICMGGWFIYRHYRHHHFHLHASAREEKNIIWPVMLAMFLSPCLEIEGYFFTLGAAGWNWALLLAGIYMFTTISSMLLWVWLGYKGLERFDAHRWTHNAGIITGVILVITGLLYFID